MTLYMMMIFAPTDPSAADAEGTNIDRWIAFDTMLKDSGVHVADHRLHEPGTATTVRVRDGEALVTGGPVAGAGEYLTGYYVLEAAALEDVVKLAADVPLIHYGSVEIRPVMSGSPPKAG